MISKIVHFFDEMTGFSDHPVFIGQLKVGTVVQDTDFSEVGDKVPADKFGHIVGFGRNINDELNLIVEWDDGLTQHMHPGNVIFVG